MKSPTTGHRPLTPPCPCDTTQSRSRVTHPRLRLVPGTKVYPSLVGKDRRVQVLDTVLVCVESLPRTSFGRRRQVSSTPTSKILDGTKRRSPLPRSCRHQPSSLGATGKARALRSEGRHSGDDGGPPRPQVAPRRTARTGLVVPTVPVVPVDISVDSEIFQGTTRPPSNDSLPVNRLRGSRNCPF